MSQFPSHLTPLFWTVPLVTLLAFFSSPPLAGAGCPDNDDDDSEDDAGGGGGGGVSPSGGLGPISLLLAWGILDKRRRSDIVLTGNTA